MPGILDYAPHAIIADFSGPIRKLKELEKNNEMPTMDIDSILSTITEFLHRPLVSNSNLKYTIDYLLSEMIPVGSLDDQEDMSLQGLRLDLFEIIQGCFEELSLKKLYIDNRFPYDYNCRRGGVVVLRKSNTACF